RRRLPLHLHLAFWQSQQFREALGDFRFQSLAQSSAHLAQIPQLDHVVKSANLSKFPVSLLGRRGGGLHGRSDSAFSWQRSSCDLFIRQRQIQRDENLRGEGFGGGVRRQGGA